ncbi:unnamed protein product (macronuclear) [Paramecium tetraurelia]|uniref:Uncharacterized protein n=1 Tax=Paramecium tetraurelia TaxID=5888 RepID=A0D8K4_PARTE|nr:uncharacterized protein GSPATT00014317001 [Paramecium tetraurelia]CAK79371.1 unnamed protein product [Paramecium tetraurelia]|eukprot:XP_001446768.1 hypothetical protein (macronuclear) [Paramecium tetraurelia strain d4-2]
MNHNNTTHRRTQSNNDIQQIICARIAGLVEDEYQQQKLDPKRINLGSTLFQIPEQNDLISSVEQTNESSKQHSQLIKDVNLSNLKPNQQQDKENFKNLSSCSALINQIQQIVKSGSNNKESLSKKPFTSINEVINKKCSTQTQMSFTQELLKKQGSNYLQQQQGQTLKQNVTPDRKRGPSYSNKPTNQKQQNDSTPNEMSGTDYLKSNCSISTFNNLIRQDQKNSNFEVCDSYRNLELKMKKIEQEISTIRQRQDHLDETNRNIQDQLKEFINDNKQQQEYDSKQLEKIEQLEQITRRNEESIACLKNLLINNNANQKRNDQNNINLGNKQQFDNTDLQKKFVDFRPLNHKVF